MNPFAKASVLGRWSGKILLVVAGLIFAALVVEGGLRLFGIEYPQFYEFDPVVGARLRPGAQGYWLKEGRGYVSINRDGLRDREHALAKSPETLRIAILGDSYAEALYVNREETFWAVMEKELEGCGQLRGRRVEVINFGQSGFGTSRELLVLRHRVWKYSPDIILLAFCTGNDLADNSPVLNQRPAEPFFLLQNGELVLDDSRVRQAAARWDSFAQNRNWLGDFYQWRQENLRIVQVMNHAGEILRQWRASREAKNSPPAKEPGAEAGMFIDIYREPADEVWQEAWKITEAVLLQMREEVAQHGARLFVVVLTNGPQVHPEAAVRQKLADWPGVQDPFYPDRRLGRFCESHGIPVLLLAPHFQEYADRNQVFLHGFRQAFRDTLGTGHWNQLGHSLAGQTIARWLCPQLK
jgi:hypothetical protein